MDSSGFFDLHGGVGDFWRLFFLYGREFYDRPEQTGKGGIGKYSDSHDFLSAAYSDAQSAGASTDFTGVLASSGGGYGLMLSCQHHGGHAGMHAGRNCRNLRSSQLSELEDIAAFVCLLHSLRDLCRNVFSVGMRSV